MRAPHPLCRPSSGLGSSPALSSPGPARWKRVTTSLPSQGLALGVPRPAQGGLMATSHSLATSHSFATSSGHPTMGLPITAATFSPSGCFSPLLPEALPTLSIAGGLHPSVFCLSPPALSPQPLWALLGAVSSADGHCPMAGGTQNSLHPVPATAQTTRSHPEQQPASWATCGNTPSSTGTSRWYVPPSGAPSGAQDPRVDPKGVKTRGFSPESHTTPMLPSIRWAGVGTPPEHHPLVAPAPVGWGQPRAQGGASVAPSRAGSCLTSTAQRGAGRVVLGWGRRRRRWCAPRVTGGLSRAEGLPEGGLPQPVRTTPGTRTAQPGLSPPGCSLLPAMPRGGCSPPDPPLHSVVPATSPPPGPASPGGGGHFSSLLPQPSTRRLLLALLRGPAGTLLSWGQPLGTLPTPGGAGRKAQRVLQLGRGAGAAGLFGGLLQSDAGGEGGLGGGDTPCQPPAWRRTRGWRVPLPPCCRLHVPCLGGGGDGASRSSRGGWGGLRWLLRFLGGWHRGRKELGSGTGAAALSPPLYGAVLEAAQCCGGPGGDLGATPCRVPPPRGDSPCVSRDAAAVLLAGCSAQGWAGRCCAGRIWAGPGGLRFAGRRLPAGWGDALGARRGRRRWGSRAKALRAMAAKPGRTGGLRGGFGLPVGLGLGGETLRLIWEGGGGGHCMPHLGNEVE